MSLICSSCILNFKWKTKFIVVPALLPYFLRYTCLVYSGLTNGLNHLAHTCTNKPETPAHAYWSHRPPTFSCTLVYACHPGFFLRVGLNTGHVNQTWNGQSLSGKVSHWAKWVGPCRTDSCSSGRSSSLLEALSVIPKSMLAVCVWICVQSGLDAEVASSGDADLIICRSHFKSKRNVLCVKRKIKYIMSLENVFFNENGQGHQYWWIYNIGLLFWRPHRYLVVEYVYVYFTLVLLSKLTKTMNTRIMH